MVMAWLFGKSKKDPKNISEKNSSIGTITNKIEAYRGIAKVPVTCFEITLDDGSIRRGSIDSHQVSICMGNRVEILLSSEIGASESKAEIIKTEDGGNKVLDEMTRYYKIKEYRVLD